MFFAQAFVFASWLARLPAIKIAFHLSEGEIGAILMALPAGAVVSAPVAGLASVLLALRGLNILSFAIMACAVAPIGIAPGPVLLVAVLFVVGFGAGAVGVAMNSAGIAAEDAVGRPVLLRCHAMFSVGLATGALASGTFVAAGLTIAAHLTTVAAFAFVAVVCVARWLPGMKPESDRQGPRFAWPSGAVVLPACIGCGSMLAKGATMDWSAIYLSNILDAPSSVASLGVAVFAGAMAVVRFFGDDLTRRMGDRPVMFTGAGQYCGDLNVGSLLPIKFTCHRCEGQFSAQCWPLVVAFVFNPCCPGPKTELSSSRDLSPIGIDPPPTLNRTKAELSGS